MQTIACYSNKGGVGKTAAAVNLAYAFAASGKHTLLCDMDPQGASSFYFRVKPSSKLTEASFFENTARVAKAIRGSDFDHLDILPANSSFRDFDAFLSQVKNRRSQLKSALKSVKSDYDLVLLDCPPNISTLSENIFRAADAVVVPVIPTTLSQRTFEQLLTFFQDNDLPEQKIHAFFSMVQSVKNLHHEVIADMTHTWPQRFMQTQIPFASEIERMGLTRAPVLATSQQSTASKAYQALAYELQQRTGG